MAQQFVLKGVKEIRDYKSTDSTFTFSIKPNPRGGDQHQIIKWWDRKANNVMYESCTVIEMKDEPYVLVIPTSMDTQLQITYDGDINSMILSNFNSVDRVLVTDKSTKKVVLEYLLPSISGGTVAKRIVQNTSTIGDFTITGRSTVDAGETGVGYKSNATPSQNLTPTYLWQALDDSDVVITDTSIVQITNADKTNCSVAWKAAGNYKIKCTITDNAASDSPQSDEKDVTVNTVNTVGTVTISSGSATPTAQSPSLYASTVTGSNVTVKYLWDVVEGGANIEAPNEASTNITFNAEGDATVRCTISSDATADTDYATKAVDVKTARILGVTSIQGDDSPEAGTADNFQVVEDGGNVVDETYVWSVTPSDGTFNIADATAEATNITFNSAGAYTVKCVVSSATASNSPAPAATMDVTVAALTEGFTGVTLGGSQSITTLNSAIPYTSSLQGGGSLVGTTTYQWTATDSDGNTSNNGAVIATPAQQNTTITYSTDSESYQVRCKWTNNSYDPATRTGMKNTDVQT